MRQARFRDGGVVLVDEAPADLREGWVRLRVEACGICGSDLHMLRGHAPAPDWLVPGHEIVGVPIDGPGGLAEARYAVEPRIWCGDCEFCATGARQFCTTGTLIGVGRSGGIAETVDVPTASLHRVRADIDALPASLAEPIAVCVRAIHIARLDTGSRVLVLGAGSIGLLSGLLARDRAERVAIVARHPQQRAAAKGLGLQPLAEDEVDAWAAEYGPDVIIETVGGMADTLGDAVRLCRVGGRVVVLGVFMGQRPINALSFFIKELTLVGSNTYGTTPRGSEFASGVGLLARHLDELAPLLTHQFALSDVPSAFDCAADKASGAIKVTVVPN